MSSGTAALRAGSLLLVDVDPRMAALLHQSELPRAGNLWTGDDEQAIAVVEQNPRSVDAVLLGARVAQPLHVAQRIHAKDPDLAIVIVTMPSRHAALRRAVTATPLLGPEVTCHPMTDDASALVEMLRGAAHATRSRREHRDMAGDEPGGRAAPVRYLGSLLEATPTGVVETDAAGRILGLNRRARALLECTERETIGASIGLLFLGGARWDDLLRCASTTPRVVERKRPTGELQSLEVMVGEAPSESRGDRYLVLLTDVSERIRAERSLRFLIDATLGLDESLDVRKTAGHVARIAVPELADWCAVDLLDDGKLQRVALARHAADAAPAATAVLENVPFRAGGALGDPTASGRSEHVARVTDELLDAIAADRLHREALGALGARALLAVPLHVRGRPLGVLTLVATSASRQFEPARIALAEDLARRAGFAIENARLFEQLRSADRAKDEFLAMLAHELRNPLAPIITATRTLAGPAAGTKAARAVEVIDRQTQHMARIVDDLLDVSRIARGRIQVQLAPLDLAELAREVAEDFRAAASYAGISVHIHAPVPCPVSGDRTRLSQVLGNLLSNAIKFSNRGGRVDVSACATDRRAVVRVTDTGSGLAPELIKAIFQPFVQADRTLDRTRGGLGLGLAIVRGIVELHGGHVSAESEGPGRGSTFSVELPLDTKAASPAPATASSGVTGKRRVLLIDDNEDLTLTMIDLLEDMGHEVRAAKDGPCGIELALQHRPELVFCDIGLPGMSGFDVAVALRREPTLARTRLVALTGYGREQDRTRAFEAGFDDFLTKPMPIATLEKILAGGPA